MLRSRYGYVCASAVCMLNVMLSVLYTCMYQSCLVPGVFSLLKLCPPSELAFLKSSLDSQGRDAFQVFMQEFKSNFKFGGRV